MQRGTVRNLVQRTELSSSRLSRHTSVSLSKALCNPSCPTPTGSLSTGLASTSSHQPSFQSRTSIVNTPSRNVHDTAKLTENLRQQLHQYEAGAWTEKDLADFNAPKLEEEELVKPDIDDPNYASLTYKYKLAAKRGSRTDPLQPADSSQKVVRPEHLRTRLPSSKDRVQQLNQTISQNHSDGKVSGFTIDEKFAEQIDFAFDDWEEDTVEDIANQQQDMNDTSTQASPHDSHLYNQINVMARLTSMVKSTNAAADPNRVIWAGLGNDGTNLLPPLPNPQETISSLDWRSFLNLRKPHLWYPAARTMNRTIIVHMGPTNSGKTHRAMNRLQEAGSGIYCGPLRLLAWENYDRLNSKGVKCSLVTGQESIETVGATHCSSTVEMVDLTKVVDVVVLDEIQMLNSDDRGSSWTQALMGVLAREVHVCGDKTSLEFIKALTEQTGEKLIINEYERLSPVSVQQAYIGDFKQLRRGDCIVVFNRKDVFLLRKRIEAATGKTCAVIYGTLPPDVRKKQAELFNDPNSGVDILIATDAIGMGLNLQIGRVIFNSLYKFDGGEFRMLHDTEILQIGGRAGRFNSEFSLGQVSVMFNREDLEYVREVFTRSLPTMEQATLMPTMEHLELFLKRFPFIPLSQYLGNLRSRAKLDKQYKLQDVETLITTSMMIEHLDLDPNVLVKLLFAPITPEKYETQSVLFKWYAEKLIAGKPIEIPAASYLAQPDVPVDEASFALLEETFANLDLYCWLANRFGNTIFFQHDRANEDKKQVSGLIYEGLLSFTERQFQQMKRSREAASQQSKSAAEEAKQSLQELEITPINQVEYISEATPKIADAIVFQESSSNDLSSSSSHGTTTTNISNEPAVAVPTSHETVANLLSSLAIFLTLSNLPKVQVLEPSDSVLRPQLYANEVEAEMKSQMVKMLEIRQNLHNHDVQTLLNLHQNLTSHLLQSFNSNEKACREFENGRSTPFNLIKSLQGLVEPDSTLISSSFSKNYQRRKVPNANVSPAIKQVETEASTVSNQDIISPPPSNAPEKPVEKLESQPLDDETSTVKPHEASKEKGFLKKLFSFGK